MGEHRNSDELREMLRDGAETAYPETVARRRVRRHGRERTVWDSPVILRLRTMLSAHAGKHTNGSGNHGS